MRIVKNSQTSVGVFLKVKKNAGGRPPKYNEARRVVS